MFLAWWQLDEEWDGRGKGRVQEEEEVRSSKVKRIWRVERLRQVAVSSSVTASQGGGAQTLSSVLSGDLGRERGARSSASGCSTWVDEALQGIQRMVRLSFRRHAKRLAAHPGHGKQEPDSPLFEHVLDPEQERLSEDGLDDLSLHALSNRTVGVSVTTAAGEMGQRKRTWYQPATPFSAYSCRNTSSVLEYRSFFFFFATAFADFSADSPSSSSSVLYFACSRTLHQPMRHQRQVRTGGRTAERTWQG